jgi:chemotaxis receptor (MCP) glutamine deamidase CheD
MKIVGFLLMTMGIGGMIAGYYLLPKRDKKNIINKKSKMFVVVTLVTMLILFVAAIGASTFSLKIF